MIGLRPGLVDRRRIGDLVDNVIFNYRRDYKYNRSIVEELAPINEKILLVEEVW